MLCFLYAKIQQLKSLKLYCTCRLLIGYRHIFQQLFPYQQNVFGLFHISLINMVTHKLLGMSLGAHSVSTNKLVGARSLEQLR